MHDDPLKLVIVGESSDAAADTIRRGFRHDEHAVDARKRLDRLPPHTVARKNAQDPVRAIRVGARIAPAPVRGCPVFLGQVAALGLEDPKILEWVQCLKRRQTARTP